MRVHEAVYIAYLGHSVDCVDISLVQLITQLMPLQSPFVQLIQQPLQHTVDSVL